MENLEFMKKFRPDELAIREFKYWIVVVRGKQVTLGDAVILLKRETENVSGMLPEEGAEFAEVVKWYEKTCREKFGASKFNYMIMMMKDPFVHYHAFPRYEGNVNMFGVDWEDDFSGTYTLINFGKPPISSDELLFMIRDYMK